MAEHALGCLLSIATWNCHGAVVVDSSSKWGSFASLHSPSFYPTSQKHNRSLDKGSSWHPDLEDRRPVKDTWLTNQYTSVRANSPLLLLDAQLRVLPCFSFVGHAGPGHEVRKLCREGQLDRALDVLLSMDEQGIVPSATVYSSLLKACSEKQALAQTKQVHAHLIKHGLYSSRFLSEFVVSTLVKCNDLDDALRVFYSLPNRSAYSWTAVISGYTSAGYGQEALRMYTFMQEDGLEPNKYTLASLLKACASMSDLQGGKRMHAEVLKYRFESDVFVGNSLVDMYSKCGNVVDARKVFDGLSHRNLVSWNVMLTAYAHHGQAQKTLDLYRLMQEEGVSPSNRTLVSVIQACSILAEGERDVVVEGLSTKPESLAKGKALHAYAMRKGYDLDSFVSCTLITMYGKCGSIWDAERVFNGMSLQDVVAWTSLLTVYVEQGQAEKGLQLYIQMQQGRVCPDIQMFVSALQACCMLAVKEEYAMVDGQTTKVKALGKIKAIHAEARRQARDSDVFVGITLLSTYGKSGSIVDSQNVFDGLPERGVVAWTALLDVYVEQCQAENALLLYYKMQEEGVTADIWTFSSLLQACGMLAEKEKSVSLHGQSTKVKALKKGKAIEAESWRLGYGTDITIGTALISMYGNCGGLVDAQNLFDKLSRQSVVAWNALVSAYLEQGLGDKALQLYRQMQEEGVSPDHRTFVIMLQACSLIPGKEEDMVNQQTTKLQCLIKGKALHVDTCRKGYQSDVFIGSSLISMYGKCGSILDAQDVFDGLPERDVGTWNAMLSAYVLQNQGEKALQLYKQMQGESKVPNEITFACVLRACSSTGRLDITRQVHHMLVRFGNISSNILASTLIHTYGRCSSMVDAQAVFDALSQPDVISWTALLAGYAREGDCAATFQCYEDMLQAGVKPNKITFLALLSACSHAGLVDKGAEYFESMIRDHGIAPEIEHYVSMVDLLGRAGYFTRLTDLLLAMPIQPSLAIWLCLMGACRMHGKVVLGRQAFDRGVGLQSKQSAAYVLMWNIYADASDWDGAREVHELRLQAGAWKQPGQCWIEHGRELHTFVVSDLEHQQKDELNALLTKIKITSSGGANPHFPGEREPA